LVPEKPETLTGLSLCSLRGHLQGGGAMSQRVSIYDLWDELQRDPSYGDRDLVQEIVNSVWADTLDAPPTFKLNPHLVAIGLATDPIFKLISVFCGLCGLSTYESGKPRPTGWSGQKFADRCHLDLEIDLDELEKVFRKYELPLPQAWFPDTSVEAQRKADLEALTVPSVDAAEETTGPVISFYRKSDYWIVGKKGEEAHLKKLNGYAFIHLLIEHPNKKINSYTVYHGKEPELKSLWTQKQQIFDRKTIQDLEVAKEELEEKLALENDSQERLEIKEEIERYDNFLKNEGRPFKRETDNARVNVTLAINSALKKIHEEIPFLRPYLCKGEMGTIKTGYVCRYEPNDQDPVQWLLYPPTED